MSTQSWLSVTEAAALSGVSEKTLRKRIAKGEVTAERETLSTGGWAWRVDANRLETSNRFQPREGSAKERLEGVAEAPGSTTEGVRELLRPDVPTASNRVAELPSVHVPSVPGGADAVRECELLREALQRERENADQWRAQVEAANRDAAELRAALREALRFSTRALPAPDESTHAGSAENALQRDQSGQTTKAAATVQGGVKRDFRPLWKVILGLRA